MGKLKGLLPIEGTFGELTFVRTARYGIVVRQKSSLSAKRIAKDRAFALTRLNNQEFGTAGKAVRLLYMALCSERHKMDAGASSRLIKVLMAALKADTASPRGQQGVGTGSPELLEGFEFNESTTLATVLRVPYAVDMDRTAGTLELTLPPFVPADEIGAPPEASHFRISVTGIEAHFGTGKHVAQTVATGVLPLGGAATTALTLTPEVTAGTTGTLLLVMGLTFYQESNGDLQAMSNRSYSPLSVIAVET